MQRRIQPPANELETQTKTTHSNTMARRNREMSTSGDQDARLARIDMITSQMGLVANRSLDGTGRRDCDAAEKRP